MSSRQKKCRVELARVIINYIPDSQQELFSQSLGSSKKAICLPLTIDNPIYAEYLMWCISRFAKDNKLELSSSSIQSYRLTPSSSETKSDKKIEEKRKYIAQQYDETLSIFNNIVQLLEYVQLQSKYSDMPHYVVEFLQAVMQDYGKSEKSKSNLSDAVHFINKYQAGMKDPKETDNSNWDKPDLYTSDVQTFRGKAKKASGHSSAWKKAAGIALIILGTVLIAASAAAFIQSAGITVIPSSWGIKIGIDLLAIGIGLACTSVATVGFGAWLCKKSKPRGVSGAMMKMADHVEDSYDFDKFIERRRKETPVLRRATSFLRRTPNLSFYEDSDKEDFSSSVKDGPHTPDISSASYTSGR